MTTTEELRNRVVSTTTEEDHEEYERVWGQALAESKIAEEITEEQVQAIVDAPSESEIDMSNMHKPTKTEVAQSIVKQIVESQNTKILIASLQELKDFEATREQPTESDDYMNGLLSNFAVKKNAISIAPKVFFDYVKDSLKETEVEILKERLKGFKQIFDITAKSGQLALNENARDEIIKLVKEQEAAACGYKTYVLESTIKTFLRDVEGKAAYFKDFKDFPRLIPDSILQFLSDAQDKNIFDQFWVLYLDYTKDSKNIKSTSTKVKDKDPILFGRLTKDSNKFFYICDWVDEYCDLTLEKFVAGLKTIDPSYTLPEVTLPTAQDIGALLVEKQRQEEVLKNTNRSNYRDLEEQEAKKKAPSFTENKNPGFISKILKFFGIL